jgi:glycosyl transferase family 1
MNHPHRCIVLIVSFERLEMRARTFLRRFRAMMDRMRGRHFFVCHSNHDHDRVYAENIRDYLAGTGLACEVLEFETPGHRPELQQCLDSDTIAVIGFNAQLDHCYVDAGNFLVAAAKRGVPVIHWILDHPSSRWPEFTHATAANSRFLLMSESCEYYFRRRALADARTAWTAGVGPNRRSRVQELSLQSFLARDINCLIALNLTRLGGTIEDARHRLENLEPSVSAAVDEAIESAQLDLGGSIDAHLDDALAGRGLELARNRFNFCYQIVDDMTQVHRRLKVFEIAASFPVLIQTDLPPKSIMPSAAATFSDNPQTNSMPATLARMQSCRAVLNVNFVNDFVGDRVENGLNAGCVPIVEDTPAHRKLFAHGKNALLFRYNDDSLAECLDIVCHRPDRAYEIALAGFELRDHPAIRFGGFHNMLDLARL